MRQSWTRIHLCFDSLEGLQTKMAWLNGQLQDCPQLLRSLELYCRKQPSSDCLAENHAA